MIPGIDFWTWTSDDSAPPVVTLALQYIYD